ncbi:hypothetical protein [Pseudanabaena sp. PCC 6802]|nr:hypothetical protein [Pseudanabaena sp. PCC 6802]
MVAQLLNEPETRIKQEQFHEKSITKAINEFRKGISISISNSSQKDN